MKKLLIASAITGLQSFTPVVFAHGTEEGYHMGPSMMWGGHGMGWWMFPIVMIVVMIIFMLFMGKRGGRMPWCGSGENNDSETPLDVLKKRYAKGEISKEEFEAVKKDLER